MPTNLMPTNLETTVAPSDSSDPPVVITGSLSWCIAAGIHVLQQVPTSGELLSAQSLDAIDRQLRASAAASVVYVCGAATPRHFDGLERLRGEHPHASLIAASPEPNFDVAQHARALGLAGYLHFDATPEELAGLLARVRAGERAYLATAERAAAADTRRFEDPDLERRVQRLTRRERQVMDLLGRGYANRDIAEALGLREGTIRIYVHRVIRQLGMRNRVDVALCASRMNKPA